MTLKSDSKKTFASTSSTQLYPPDITGLVKPIDGDEGYDGGLGAAALTADLLVIVDPWLYQEIGDKCFLFWKDEITPVRTEFIDTPEKLNLPVHFRIPSSQIQDGAAFPVFYRVKRRSGNESDSVNLKILVKRALPGGVLDKPEPSGHPGLPYTLIPDITAGIDNEMAKQGIVKRIASYQNISVYDRIVARWGNDEQVIYYPVTPEQASDPQNHPILLTFDEYLIKRAGDGKHLVTYQVIDRCGNRPHDHAAWSVATEVNVRVKKIPAPTVTGEEAGVLDPAFVENVQVIASGVGLVAGDNVRVQWQGRTEHETDPMTYSGSGDLAFPIPPGWVNESDQSVVSITLRVERSEEKLTSDAKTVNIKTTIVLKPPKVLEAYGENHDRLKMADIYEARHVTVQVQQYVGMAIGQTVRVRWASERHVYDSDITTVAAVGAMNILVPRMEVVDSIGSTVPVNFTVRTFINGPLHRAEPLQLKIDVQPFELPPPRFSSDQTLVTVRYPAMTDGYQARVRWGGVVTRRTEWQNMHPDNTAAFSIPTVWLNENKGTTVLINYSVHQTGSNEQSQFSQVLRVVL
ncbi:hypothetical protein [Pseudomonas sp. Sample_23]|uniref:hypothetical protein n=1 Tax=Pseudomonas sp. Sample_23 TaxID=2448267 RepID=UPI001032E607|nr:hypothetical protein [Pseudomonas sp. Sample_23]